MTTYIVQHRVNPTLYYNKELGWGLRKNATEYSPLERAKTQLPENGLYINKERPPEFSTQLTQYVRPYYNSLRGKYEKA